MESSTKKNQHVEDFLKYYISMPAAPQYAVLVNGEWGSGKTWFIENFIKNHQKLAPKTGFWGVFGRDEKIEEVKFLYVSLYGVSSISQIEDKFFQELHPRLASTGAAIGGAVAKGLIKKYAGTELKGNELTQFLKNSEGCILVFDDLERCSIKISEVLGYINGFVEHQKQRVIILAHEKEITDQDEYKKKSEKLIGKKLTISSSIPDALASFIAELGNKDVARFLEVNKDSIAGVYHKAESANLRILRHSILEFERLYGLLPEAAKEHEEFLRIAMQTFVALLLEVKRGNLSPHEISGLNSRHTGIIAKRVVGNRLGKKEEPQEVTEADDSFKDAYERVFGTSMSSPIPSLDFLFHFLQFGTVPQAVVDEMMLGCRFFQNENTPSWMKLWRIWHLEDKDFAALYPDVLKDFKAYQFTKQGDIKHIAGMLLFFARNGLLAADLETTFKEVLTVISEMAGKNLIEEVSWVRGSDPLFNQASSSLQFMDLGTEEFKAVVDKIADYQARRHTESIRARTTKLLELIRTDSRQFIDELTGTNTSTSELYRIPVLKELDPKKFIEAYIQAPAKNRPDVFYALQERYKRLGIAQDLTQELDWVKTVSTELEGKLSQLSQPTKFHAEDFLKKVLRPSIVMIEKFQREQAKH